MELKALIQPLIKEYAGKFTMGEIGIVIPEIGQSNPLSPQKVSLHLPENQIRFIERRFRDIRSKGI